VTEPQPSPAHGESLDTLFDGRIRLWQSVRGLRTSVDALELAALSTPRDAAHPGRFLELGAGAGLSSILLLRACPGLHGVALELQPELARRCVRNAAENAVAERLEVRCDDLCVATRGSLPEVDLVISNPPWHAPDRTQASPVAERRLGHSEQRADVEAFARAAALALNRRGRWCVIYPAWGIERLLAACAAARLHPQRLRFVHHHCAAPARRVFMESRPTRRQALRVEPPLIVHEAPGARSFGPEIATFVTSLGGPVPR